ncbi:hypothetical protein RJ641_002342 [Dillenia turbinata]|uniref:Uncharacterized protein n=1 Tax=Dillenia turbinata TaxID=194707 RepID=A0AAN8ZG72_9MAGN
MDAEEILNLFDIFWFNHEILKAQSRSTIYMTNPVREIRDKLPETENLRIPKPLVRSMSEQLDLNFDSLSPNSVLQTPKLEKILSGKEVGDEDEVKSKKLESRGSKRRTRMRRRGMSSKSLTELEYEELKGFMDLGFVFLDEDKDSNLVSIIPGLKTEKEKKEGVCEISRPYLSEAWDVRERRKREKPLMNWRVPASSNEIDMKLHLRHWARTVASTFPFSWNFIFIFKVHRNMQIQWQGGKDLHYAQGYS